jgi:hypothetical protein
MASITQGPIHIGHTFCLQCSRGVIVTPATDWNVKDGNKYIGSLHDVCREPWEAKNPNSGLTFERGT